MIFLLPILPNQMGGDFYVFEYFLSAIVFFFLVPILMILKNDNLSDYVLQRLKSFIQKMSKANNQVCPTMNAIQA